MQQDFKLIDRIPSDKITNYLQICKLLITDQTSDKIPKDLAHSEKIVITKLLKIIKVLCKTPKKALMDNILDKLEKKDAIKQILAQLYFSRTLNNYQLIKSHFNKQTSPNDYSRVVLGSKSKLLSDVCVNFEYRIQVTLSSHKAKKVLRPLILLVFTMQDDQVVSFYVDINQFQEIRKHAALGLKTLHQIQSKG